MSEAKGEIVIDRKRVKEMRESAPDSTKELQEPAPDGTAAGALAAMSSAILAAERLEDLPADWCQSTTERFDGLPDDWCQSADWWSQILEPFERQLEIARLRERTRGRLSQRQVDTARSMQPEVLGKLLRLISDYSIRKRREKVLWAPPGVCSTIIKILKDFHELGCH
jgi:hypothetical protein